MAPQSQALQSGVRHVLLTRPALQSQRFARSLRAAFAAPLHVMIAPLMAPQFLAPLLPLPAPQGLIFSSETGAAAYARLQVQPIAPAWCVGKRTAKAAVSAGLEPVLIASDVADLLNRMIALRPTGPFLHLRGKDSTGNLTQSLSAAGIEAAEAIIYDQRPVPLAPRALRLLQGAHPVVVPVFSARSMRLLCAAAPTTALLRIAALSPAVAAAMSNRPQAQVVVCPSPNAESMVQTVIYLLREPALP